MSLPVNFRPRVRHQVFSHVVRSLNGPGSLKVSLHEEIHPGDILGQSQASAGFFTVKLSQKLKASPKEALKYLRRPIGETIFGGELLAQRKTLFGETVVTSPSDGIISSYNDTSGELLLKFIPKLSPLVSGVHGIVDLVNHQTGEVVIKTMSTEVNGIVGVGKERSGILTVLNDGQRLIDPTKISDKMSHRVLVCGSIFGEGLHRAIGFQLSAVLCGGLNMRDFKAMARTVDRSQRVGTDAGITVIATEGFGVLPIGQDILKQVLLYDNKFVYIDGNAQKLMLPSQDPDSIILLRKVALPRGRGWDLVYTETQVVDLKVGAKVRTVSAPFAGYQGQVIAIDSTPSLIESGISTYLVTIETTSRKIKVPYLNVEVVELRES